MIDIEATKNTLEEVLEQLGLPHEGVHYVADALHPIFSIKMNDGKKLIGPKGEHLRALNYIVKRIVERRQKIENASLLVDVNNYQQERNEEVRRRAKVHIERVRSFKISSELEPMSPYERMLVHSMVADDPEIETISSGEGPQRRITVRYRAREGSSPL